MTHTTSFSVTFLSLVYSFIYLSLQQQQQQQKLKFRRCEYEKVYLKSDFQYNEKSRIQRCHSHAFIPPHHIAKSLSCLKKKKKKIGGLVEHV